MFPIDSAPQLLPYISNYRYSRDDITLRHHITHTSEGVPGEENKYNGFLYGRLSNVVDEVYPKKFIGLVQDSIIGKLKMTHTLAQFKDAANSNILKSIARPYYYEDGRPVPFRFPDPVTLNAGAGIISCAQDLAKFDIAIDKNELMSAHSKAEAFTAMKSKQGKIFPNGLGWFVSRYKKYKIIFHYGLQETFSGIYIKVPEEDNGYHACK